MMSCKQNTTIDDMNIIFKCVVGSQSYGTATPTSDTDIKGVYIQSIDDLITYGYCEQINTSKDETYYEVRRFLTLLQTANPTVLEMLYTPEDHIITKTPEFDLILAEKEKFLTKNCRFSFGGYAVAQIKKAKGLDKKMNWEKSRVDRKTPLDFTYAYEDGKTMPLIKWLSDRNLKQEYCGLVALDHFPNSYALYYDTNADTSPMGFKGIILNDSNEVRLSSVPKGMSPLTVVQYNKDGYSMHCKDYNDYQKWLENRNTQRYVDIEHHDQQIDGKNLLHCRRLLDVAIEIATEGKMSVRRPNADYLLSIRRGEVDLETIITKAEEDIKVMDEAYMNSNLPDTCSEGFITDLLLKIRKSSKDDSWVLRSEINLF